MTDTKRIAILTGGGDVPGLNAVIKSVVYRATEAGYDVLGIRRGWEGLTHVQPGRAGRGRPGLPAPARPDQHADDRPDRRHDPAHVADEPAQDARRRRCPPGWTPPTGRGTEVADGVYDLTPIVLDNLAALGIDVLVTIGGDDTLSYSQVLADAGVAAHGHPQDDGQRRPGDRVLHRVLDGDHPGQGGDQPPAHDARLARADRRLPDLRARRRASRRCTRRT